MLFFNRQINFFIFSENTGNIFAVYGNKIEKEDFFIMKIKLNHDGESKKMKWNFRKIVVAAAVIQLGCFCTTAAEDSSSEKNGIIDEIVNTKIKEAKGADALSEVLDAVAEKIPLDTDKETPESSAYIEKLEEQARKKFPAADQELENKYRPIAEKSYPVYNTGDHITVVYLLHGKPFTVSGQYYRQDSRFVWIGSKKILKAQLGGEYASRFDLIRTKQLRASFVAQNIRRYHQQRELHFKKLKSQNHEKISELRGEIKFNGKWLPPRKVVMEKYAAAFARQDRLIAESIQKAKDSPDYNERCKILESVIQKYPDHKSIPDAETLLEKFKTVFGQKTEEVKNILAYCSQPKVSYSKLNHEYKINLRNRDILSQIQNRFRGIAGCDQLQNRLRSLQLKMFQMSLNAVKQLVINDPRLKPQLIIRKKINVDSNCRLLIFSLEAEEEVTKFYDTLLKLGQNWNKYKHLQKESENLAQKAKRLELERKNAEWRGDTSGPTGIEVWQASQDSSNTKLKSYDALKQATLLKREAELMLVPVSSKGRSGGGIQSAPVSLSNVKGPIIILAWEQLDFGDGFEALQGWYTYFTPSGDTQEWILK